MIEPAEWGDAFKHGTPPERRGKKMRVYGTIPVTRGGQPGGGRVKNPAPPLGWKKSGVSPKPDVAASAMTEREAIATWLESRGSYVADQLAHAIRRGDHL